MKCIKQGFNSTLKLTEAVHFDPEHPEYHNVYISNLKNKYAMVYKNGAWSVVVKKEVIDKLYDDKKNYIEDNLETFYESLSTSRKNALKRWLDTEDDQPKINTIKEDIKLLLFNKRDIPITTHKKISDTSNNCKDKDIQSTDTSNNCKDKDIQSTDTSDIE